MISLGLMVKNEASLLSDCLESVSEFCDEIIVVDNNSTDNTQEIATRFGSKIIYSPNTDLDEGRNLYIEAATQPWILTLDADERMTPDGIKTLKMYLKSVKENVMGIYLPFFQYIGNGRWAYTQVLRVIRNHPKIRYNSSKIHASPQQSIIKLDGQLERSVYAPIHHFDILLKKRTSKKRDKYRNLLIEKINEEKDANAFAFLGNEYAAIGDVRRAEENYKIAIKCSKFEVHRARAQLYLAQLYLSENKSESAKKILNEIIENSSTEYITTHALTLLAEIEVRINNWSEAISYCQRAITEFPYGAHLHLNLGCLLNKQGEGYSGIAKKYLKQAINLNPYLLEPIIHYDGEKPNIFEQQNVILSSSDNYFDLLKEIN